MGGSAPVVAEAGCAAPLVGGNCACGGVSDAQPHSWGVTVACGHWDAIVGAGPPLGGHAPADAWGPPQLSVRHMAQAEKGGVWSDAQPSSMRGNCACDSRLRV